MDANPKIQRDVRQTSCLNFVFISIVRSDGIKLSPGKGEVIISLPKPKTVTEVGIV